MPTYTVRSANCRLSPGQRDAIAAAITEVHQAQTGAPGYLAQVIFDPVADGHHYIGGRPNHAPHVFVHGLIRAGRTATQKRRLMEHLAARVRDAASVGPEDIWVYVQEIAPEQMIEFGRPLPAPGAEAEWRRGLTPAKRAALGGAGVTADG